MASRLSQGAITYRSEPVDATQVPNDLPGFRTMFNALHHLRPEQARAMLADAVAKGEGVGVFESGSRSLLMLLGALGTPLRVLVLAPFIRPFRWSRLFWTYLVPALPLVLLFDVIVSCLRIYSARPVPKAHATCRARSVAASQFLIRRATPPPPNQLHLATRTLPACRGQACTHRPQH